MNNNICKNLVSYNTEKGYNPQERQNMLCEGVKLFWLKNNKF